MDNLLEVLVRGSGAGSWAGRDSQDVMGRMRQAVWLRVMAEQPTDPYIRA